jgi:competence protein ComEC
VTRSGITVPVHVDAPPDRPPGGGRHRPPGTTLRWSAGRVGGLLPGLVVGDTSRMDPVLDEEFQRAGPAVA